MGVQVVPSDAPLRVDISPYYDKAVAMTSAMIDRRIDSDEVYDFAIDMLIRTAQIFDADRGMEFERYLMTRVWLECRRYIAKHAAKQRKLADAAVCKHSEHAKRVWYNSVLDRMADNEAYELMISTLTSDERALLNAYVRASGSKVDPSVTGMSVTKRHRTTQKLRDRLRMRAGLPPENKTIHARDLV